MAQSLECLSCKHKDLRFDPQHPYTKSGMVRYPYNPGPGGKEVGRQEDPWGSSACLTLMGRQAVNPYTVSTEERRRTGATEGENISQ